MLNSSDILRGYTDTIILAQLAGGDSYGYEINKVIATLSNNRFELKEATLYTAFKRLEESGSITSYWGNEATGARRRYYAITEQGRKNYEALLEEWKDARAMIDELTNKEGY